MVFHWQQRKKRHTKNLNIIIMEMSSQLRAAEMAGLDMRLM